ncbi:MAG: hypothetical protein IT208_15245 [Chthonomonadales bacterium]|nr:hypothetical protein [Chthonomonadales bacterium]
MTAALIRWLGVAAAGIVILAPPATAAGEAAAGGRAKLVTLDYANAEVTDVIRALSAQSGVNIALSPGARGQVSVHLRDKAPDEAIEMVVNLAGLAARRVGDTFVVAPRAEMRGTLERMGETRTAALKHLAAQAAADMLQAAYADLTVRPQGNAVVLVGATEDLDGAQALLEQSDRPSPDTTRVTERIAIRNRQPAPIASALQKMVQGLVAEAAGDSVVLSGTQRQVEKGRSALAMLDTAARPSEDTRVYQIRYAPPAQLIALLQRAVPDVQVVAGPESYAPPRPKFNIISGQIAGMFTDGNDKKQGAGDDPAVPGGSKDPVVGSPLSLFLKGSPAALDEAARVLGEADVAPKQLEIEARVVETSPERVSEIGLKWSWTRFGFYEAPAGTEVSTNDTGGIGGDFTHFFTKPSGMGVFSRVPWSFQAFVNAIVTDKQTRLLASPRITAVNDQDASIFIGDTLRVRVLATSSATSGSQFTVLEVPVGIVLLVHPRVNDDQNITLRVHPVVSTLTGFVDGLPQTAAREADTTVRVKDGDTIAIGGLIRDEDIRTMQKIPILGDLPLLGNLFRNESKSHRRTEVMVFLTIRMLRP